MNINNEARKHLARFLNKVLERSYTRSEYENFLFSGYQEPMLENVRKEVAKIISKPEKITNFETVALDAETRNSIQAVIDELEKISV